MNLSEVRIVTNKRLVLVNDLGEEIKKDQIVTSFRGDQYVITGWSDPKTIGSTGRIYCMDTNDPEGWTREFFPSVLGFHWEERP